MAGVDHSNTCLPFPGRNGSLGRERRKFCPQCNSCGAFHSSESGCHKAGAGLPCKQSLRSWLWHTEGRLGRAGWMARDGEAGRNSVPRLVSTLARLFPLPGVANGAGKIPDVAAGSQGSSLQVSVPELVCPGSLVGRNNQLSSYVGDRWSGVGLLGWPFGLEGIVQEACEQGVCWFLCHLRSGSHFQHRLICSTTGSQFVFGLDSKGEVWDYGCTDPGMLGSPCAALSSCQRRWESCLHLERCRGWSCSTPSPAAGPQGGRAQRGLQSIGHTVGLGSSG